MSTDVDELVTLLEVTDKCEDLRDGDDVVRPDHHTADFIMRLWAQSEIYFQRWRAARRRAYEAENLVAALKAEASVLNDQSS